MTSTGATEDTNTPPFIRKDYVARSGIAAFTMFLPNIRVFLILLLLAISFSDEVRAAVALGGSVSGLVTVLASGFVATTVRSTAIAYKKSGGMTGVPSALAKELSPALGAAALLVVVGVAVLAVGMIMPGASRLFAVYLGFALASIALAPLMFVLNGAFQALQQDGRNLWTAVIGTCVQLAIAVIVVIWAPSGPIAVAVLGLGVSLAAVIGCSYRMLQLSRLGALQFGDLASALISILRRPANLFQGLLERAAASIDGVVFVAFFTLAIMVATAYDPSSGAVVGLAVTLMRATVVPLKQFGLVGGRFVLREEGKPGAMNLASVQRSCAMILSIAASILILVRLATPILDELPWIIVAMMVVQLILEPWGSVLYSYTKVVHSAYKGLPALLIAYVAVGAPGLAMVAFFGGASPVAVWTVLIVTRVLFVGIQALALYRRKRSAETSAKEPHAGLAT